MSLHVCRFRAMTAAQLDLAARRSVEVNPENATVNARVDARIARRGGGSRRLAVVIGHRWPSKGVNLTVQFLDTRSKRLRARILRHMNAWARTANVLFRETNDVGQVRISRRDDEEYGGYWSYLGTQILGIEDDEPTMNLEGFTARTSDAEFRRVVRHEAGHTLGFDHEHLRSDLVDLISQKKAIKYYRDEFGWTARETREQVLTPLKDKSTFGTTEADPLSVMCYEIPAEITKNGKPIIGGVDINERDYAFAAKIYPKKRSSNPAYRARNEEPPASELLVNSGQRLVPSQGRETGETMNIVVLDGFDEDSGRRGAPGGMPTYVRVLANYAGARVSEAMQVRVDDDGVRTRFGKIIGAHERIKAYTDRGKGSLPDDIELKTLGANLFESLFQGEVRRLYDEARTRERGRRLNLVLTSMVPWIAEKPWEFCFDDSRKSFLATEEVHFMRSAIASVPADEMSIRRGPLRILVVSAQPVGFGHLSVDQERNVIKRGFDPLVAAGLATIEAMPRATPVDLLWRLSDQSFDAVHFIGHGVFDKDTEKGYLLFEDGSSGPVRLSAHALRGLFCGRGLRLVFFNSCQSASGGRSEFNGGVAQSLVSHGVPAVVANQYSVLDASATWFSQTLYWALARGMSIGQAAREARVAVSCSMQGDPIDWAVPVVYATDPDLVLFAPDEMQRVSESLHQRGPRRTKRRTHPTRVAVWDIDNVFPELDATMAEMSDAQSQFEFSRADLSPPMDIWDREDPEGDGTVYLWAEKLQRRLAGAPGHLDADAVVCVTRHWLRDDDCLNLYSWWPAGDETPIIIASFAGLEGLVPDGVETDRGLANMIVSGLAGYFADLGTHEMGSRSCPMWFNENRELGGILGRQVFDGDCLEHIKDACPEKIPAFNALLALFFRTDSSG